MKFAESLKYLLKKNFVFQFSHHKWKQALNNLLLSQRTSVAGIVTHTWRRPIKNVIKFRFNVL